MHSPTDRITKTMHFVTPVVEHWLDPSGNPLHHQQILYQEYFWIMGYGGHEMNGIALEQIDSLNLGVVLC